MDQWVRKQPVRGHLPRLGRPRSCIGRIGSGKRSRADTVELYGFVTALTLCRVGTPAHGELGKTYE